MSARRQQILAALVTRLETITTGNGYLTSGGSNVRLNPDKDTEPTAQGNTAGFVIRETGGTEAAGMVGENFGVIECDITAHATALKDNDPNETASDLWTDLMVALGTDKTLGGLCDDLVSAGHEASETQGGKRYAARRQSFRLHYRTTRWAPATAPA